ncbi:phosphoglycolate phosphatase [Stappia aggregata IAM 12614]|uniref:phosphoglycolate phosphatase n=1 Tax=Roseibium aggregatum (strain ATCC 25650 / DSM 13394 / JCM 20685 / NBRC 16684 / NCIMB 2208 / IAM 12614 / B1) TaxID=384765 RepID=A0P440_ROSAI|nr:HAD family hydrolase [Roseibium aggregatum]EAV40214.1 phosphoglycolate phosphatase [Stappia aggregata IAM 12614] [Roseibium aggregatum IAM 12614]
MSINNVIFDWDGTLAKTLDLWLEGFQVSFSSRGLRFDPKYIVKEFFHDHPEVPNRHPDIEFPTVAEETRNYVLNGLSTVELYEGVTETLKSLKNKGITLTLVTSSPRHLLDRALGAHNLEFFFDSIVAGDDGFGHKPSPMPFKATLERVGAMASETLIIGDSHVDIQAGKSSGCQTCWFAPEHNSLFHDFERIGSTSPDHEISRVQELNEIL